MNWSRFLPNCLRRGLVEGKVISITNGYPFDINGIMVGIVRGEELFSESAFADLNRRGVEATVLKKKMSMAKWNCLSRRGP